MRRALVLVAVGLLAAPCAASAAPFGEIPFQPSKGAAVCLAPTGLPGTLVRWTAEGAELLDATPGGLVPQATVALGKLRRCPAAALDASGAGVLAGPTKTGVRISVRDPGGGWTAPLTVPVERAEHVTAAVSARGDVVVAWVTSDEDYEDAHVEVVRRSPGGAVGTPQRFSGGRLFAGVEAGMSAAGEAVLVLSGSGATRVVTAPAGAAFGAPRRLLDGESIGGDPTLAVTASGRALIAVVGIGEGTTILDREPGGEFVRRPSLPIEGTTAVAMRDDGTAVVTWESLGSLTVMRRSGTGTFGAPIRVQRERPRRQTESSFYGYVSDTPLPGAELRAALGADGTAVLTWPGVETGLQAATVAPDGTAEVADLGSPVRPADGMTPLVLADGRRAVAWTDMNEIDSWPPYAGRMHLAIEGGADAPTGAAPELTVGAPRDRTLRPAQSLVLPLRCSAACDVRAYIHGRSGASSASLAKAGAAKLSFNRGSGALIPKRGTLKVTVAWSAPGARAASTRTLALRLRRLPAPPLPHLLDVRARRTSGGVVDVRWRTDGPALDAYFTVYGTRIARGRIRLRDANIGTAAGGPVRRSFHVRLRDAEAVRYVTVAVVQPLGRDEGRTKRVRVQ